MPAVYINLLAQAPLRKIGAKSRAERALRPAIALAPRECYPGLVKRPWRAALLAALLAAPVMVPAARAEDEYEQFRYLYIESRRPMFRRVEGTDGSCVLTTDRPAAIKPASFSCRKAPGVKRVFVIGGSVAGDVNPYASPPGSGVEWINCGMGQYDSSRDEAILDEVLRYEPDLVILTTGNNEGLPEAGPLSVLVWRVRRALGLSHPLRGYSIQQALARHDEARASATLEERESAMIRRARAAGAEVIACTLPVNYADLPPWGESPWRDPDLVEGALRAQAGDARGAEAAFGRSLARSAARPFALFWRGRLRLSRGDRAGARADFLAAVQANGLGRVTPTRNDAVRRAAAAGGADLVDLFERVELLGGGLIGFDVIRDNVHWRGEIGPDVVAAVLAAPAARRVLGSRVTARGPGAGPGRPRRSAPGALDPSARDMAARGAVQWLEAERWFRPTPLAERTVAYFEEAVRTSPALLDSPDALIREMPAHFGGNVFAAGLAAQVHRAAPRLLAHFAEVARRRGRGERALALFDRSLAADPSFAGARLGRAQALWRLGRSEEAAADLRAAAAGGFPAEAAALEAAFSRVAR